MTETWHGTINGYTNHQCRCPECHAAFAAYFSARRAKKRALGICTECNTKAMNDSRRCQKHCDYSRASSRRRYAAAHLTYRELLSIVEAVAMSPGVTLTLRDRARTALAKRSAMKVA